MNFEERKQQLIAEKVQPWLDKLDIVLPHHLRVDGREGYAGDGVLGARAGPWDSLDFDNVIHELAHGIEMVACGRVKAFIQNSWGMRIKSVVRVGTQTFNEPHTMQATKREARVCGIQLSILKAVGYPDCEKFSEEKADVLNRWMPDWICGGSTNEERLLTRKSLIEKSHRLWPIARVQEVWPEVVSYLDHAHKRHLQRSERKDSVKPAFKISTAKNKISF